MTEQQERQTKDAIMLEVAKRNKPLLKFHELPADLKSRIKMYYWFGVIDYCVAWLLLITGDPIYKWILIWAGNIMFIATLGAYWTTKAEELRLKAQYGTKTKYQELRKPWSQQD